MTALRITYRQTKYWDFSDASGVKRVHFVDKSEQSFVSADCDTFSILSEHLILLDYLESWSSVYIASKAKQPEIIYERLIADIASVNGNWRPQAYYFNSQVRPVKLLSDGYGLLMTGPQTIVSRASLVLTSAGLRHTVLPAQSSRWPMKALIAGRNFVIARDFYVAQSAPS
jgi:hypothetical protein